MRIANEAVRRTTDIVTSVAVTIWIYNIINWSLS